MTTHTLEISPSRGYVVVTPLYSTTITVPTSYGGIKVPHDRQFGLYNFVYNEGSVQASTGTLGWDFNDANLENVTQLILQEDTNTFGDDLFWEAVETTIVGKQLFLWNYDYPNEWVIYNVNSVGTSTLISSSTSDSGVNERQSIYNVSFYSSSVTSWTGTGNLIAGRNVSAINTEDPASWAGDSNTPLTITGTKDQINAFLQRGSVRWYDYPDDFYTLSERYVSPATTDVTLDYTVIRNGVRDTSFPVVLNLYVAPDPNPLNLPV